MIPARGFILGKFLPPHRGHLHLVEHGRRRVERLTALVCSLPADPIPGALRYQWMCELFPDVDVQHLTEIVPSYPHEHPDFWDIWRGIVLRACGGQPPDVIFTSEDYGDTLAQVVGCRHECVDRERRAFPVSGTLVRGDPRACWDLLPPQVQKYYESLGAPTS